MEQRGWGRGKGQRGGKLGCASAELSDRGGGGNAEGRNPTNQLIRYFRNFISYNYSSQCVTFNIYLLLIQLIHERLSPSAGRYSCVSIEMFTDIV